MDRFKITTIISLKAGNTITLITLNNLNITIPKKTLVKDLNASFNTNEFIAILGQNGAGKSLTLHTIAGIRKPSRGIVSVFGNDIDLLNRRDIAEKLSLLTQDSDDALPSTVFDSVLIGRHPHIGVFDTESKEDIEMTIESLEKVDLVLQKHRDVHSLSGGERRRLSIAQVINQNSNIILLDEPTNHLDPYHQFKILNIFQKMSDDNYLIIATMHDLNLISRYANRCLFLFGDGEWLLGRTEDLMTEENLTELYKVKIKKINHNGQSLFIAS
jgi:iron complex transport system ATP-binding protein